MSAFLDSVAARARALQKRIVFPEGDDPRVREAAARLAADGVARPIVVSTNTRCDPGVACIDPSQSSNIEKYGRIYYERRRSRGVTEMEARRIALEPIYFASLALAAGDADGLVGGAANTTAETVRALIHCVGVEPGARLVSSFMIQEQPNKAFGDNGVLIFADPAVVPKPTPSQLAEIAIAAGRNARRFLQAEPRVAMLSFSTKGSARHPLVDEVLEAVRIIKARAPELAVDGELQADAALIPSVGPIEVAGLAGGGPRQRADLSGPQRRQHRLQAGRAHGRREVVGAVPARAGQARQRSLARGLGGEHLLHGGRDGAASRPSLRPRGAGFDKARRVGFRAEVLRPAMATVSSAFSRSDQWGCSGHGRPQEVKMDSLPIAPVSPDPFPAVRTERIARTRSDRDREPPSKRTPQRRRPSNPRRRA
jgi:phosphate acetyltransferase